MPASFTGAEVWITGTPAELDVIEHALTAAGKPLHTSPRHRLTGQDAGRYRLYLRLNIPTRRDAGRPSSVEPEPVGGTLIDLETARNTRRRARPAGMETTR